MSKVIIGVDLGGTRVRAARLDEHLMMLERKETLTEADQGLEPTLERIKNLIREVWPQDGSTVAGIGISAPGPLNPQTGVVVAPPNLAGWHNVPLGDILHEVFNAPIFVGNDANVAALAETALGAARGCNHVVFITVSTGVGGGMIIDGRMLLGKDGLGAEAGHIILVVDGNVSTLEKEVAGPALARKARARIEKGETSIIPGLVGGDLSQLRGSVVGEAARQGDTLALNVVRQAGKTLGLGIVTFLHLFNPEILVIGGGVATLGELLLKPMREAIETYAIDRAYWERLRMEPAGLGEDVSLIGAAALVITQGGQENINAVIARLRAES